MVLAEDKRIYYAKTNSIEFCITGTGWEVTSFNLQWKKDWFNLDFVAPIVNFFKPAEIYAMEGARSVAISHKRQDAQDYTLFLKRHREPAAGITTLYMLDPTGTRILFADPWLPNKFHNEITGPEEGRFVAESMDASASTLFLIQRAKDSHGREIHKMYTRFADFSNIGSASLSIKNQTPDVRGHPFEDWREQPMIPLKGQARLTKHVTILQTGKSRGERELRVEGTDQRGHTGYYHKGIYAHSWHFKRTDHAIPQKEFLPQKERGSGLRSGPAIAKDYTGWIKTQTGKFCATLRRFSKTGLNERGLHTTLDIELSSGKKISCPVYAQRGVGHLFGYFRNRPNWTLIVPEKPSIPIKSQGISVDERPHRIVIEGDGFRAEFNGNGKAPYETPLPHPIVRTAIKVILVVLRVVKNILKFGQRLVDKIRNKESMLKVKQRLSESLHLENTEDSKKVIRSLIAKNPSLVPQTLVDFVFHPNIAPHLRDLMMGANMCVVDPQQRWAEKLSSLPGVKRRPSSHEHQEGKCWGLETPLFKELLFWVDKKGNLRVQFEGNSLGTLFKVYYHLVDYFEYKHQGRQQGPYGTSHHTDASPIVVRI